MDIEGFVPNLTRLLQNGFRMMDAAAISRVLLNARGAGLTRNWDV